MAKRKFSQAGTAADEASAPPKNVSKKRSSVKGPETVKQDDPASGSVPLVPYVPPRQYGRANNQPGQQDSGNVDDGRIEERWFLGMGSKIVGIQYYNGVVSDRENVILRRQPNNPYDKNAVQVLNVRDQQIGHLPREMAAAIAPIMDQRPADGMEELRFEGFIPRGSGNVFSMPLKLAVFGRDPTGTLAPRLQNLGIKLRGTFCSAARGQVEVQASQEADGTPVDQVDDKTWASMFGARPRAKSGPSMSDVIERELENIYRSGQAYEDAVETVAPDALRTSMYPHQLKALHWMRNQECDRSVDQCLNELAAGDVAPICTDSKRKKKPVQVPRTIFFWTKEQGPSGTVYKNLATNSAFKQPPRLPRGGILADDMGLGKTITVLALILSDGLDTNKSSGTTPAGGNLIVCPLSVLYNWSEQIKLHAPSISLRLYYGQNRNRSPHCFASHDVTLTTYDTVRSEARDGKPGLKSIAWRRTVLDEAHTIKNHKAATSKAIFETISSERRWCLTGTPIQNSVEDLFSLAKFLKLEPFDHYEWFNRTILRPLKHSDVVGFERLQVLLKAWCLRRTKDMRILDAVTGVPRPLLMLPEKTMKVVKVPLGAADQILYDRMFKCARDRVQQLETDSDLGRHFSQVLGLLMRLRQLCCASSLLPDDLIEELKTGARDPSRVLNAAVAALGSDRVEVLLKNLSAAQDDECSVCMTPGCDAVTRCGHVFHLDCLEDVVKTLGKGGECPCPLCRQTIKRTELLEKPPDLEISEEGGSSSSKSAGPTDSTKIKSVMSLLQEEIIGKVDDHLGKPNKVIIFSQFTSVLDLVQHELKRNQFPFARVDGSMSHEKRVLALQAFSGYDQVQVILCSLKAAGTGLNLTSANHVVLIDPWWNPAAEDQAVDRAHRLGQRRPVKMLRYVAERTVEERILEVHAQKRELMDGALKKMNREEIRSMRLRTVASLFDPFV